jgi:intein-encoded DNA endonuclease-like protein
VSTKAILTQSLIDIAKECGCSRQNVLRRIRQSNIPLRTQKEARKLAYDRHKISYTITNQDGIEKLVTQGSINTNEKFFSTWSKEMAYVLGVLYTDGNLYHDAKRETYRIALAQKQTELLNKVLKLMDCDARLRHRKKRGITGEVYFFDIQQKKVYSDLINLGLSPIKNRTIEFPDIPPEFVRHFIRGCWDGDGSIYFESGKLRGSYTCGSFEFIAKIVQELYRVEIYKRTPPLDKS